MAEVSMSRCRVNLHADSIDQIYLDAEGNSGVGVRMALSRHEAEAISLRLFALSRGRDLGPAKPSLNYEEVISGLAGPFTYCMVSRDGSVVGGKCYKSAHDALYGCDFDRPGYTLKPLFTKEFVIAFRDEALNNYKAAQATQASDAPRVGLWFKVKSFVKGVIG